MDKYEIIKTNRATDQCNLERKGSIRIDKVAIPYTYTRSTIVYFVSGDNGDEFGQYPTLELAKEQLNKCFNNAN